MKKLLLTAILSVSTIFGASQAHAITSNNLDYEAQFIATEICDRPNPDYCGNNSLTNGLESNETTLFYMYSNDEGMYFLDPLAEYENVIFVGHNDYKILPELKIDTNTLHHGKKFVGVFADDELWELVGLNEVEYE